MCICEVMNNSKPTTTLLDSFLTTQDLINIELALNDLADYEDITHRKAKELLSKIKKLNSIALAQDEPLNAFIQS